MKKSTIGSMITAIIISSAAVAAHANSYDPVAPDRYSITPSAYKGANSTDPEYSVHPSGPEKQGFHPFATNRYTASSRVAGEQRQLRSVAIGSKRGKFNPFAANRYTR